MDDNVRFKLSLVEETFAADGAAEARDTICGVDFALEFVVVGEFLVWKKY